MSTYDVYRNGSLYSPGVPAGTQTFLNTGSNVVSGTTYTYFIRARNASGSTDSNSLQATAPSCATTPIPATPASTTPGSTSSPGPTTASSTVVVAWGASNGATYYDLGIRDVAAGSLVVSTQVTGTSYSANLTAGKQYRWNVAACNGSGCSAFTTALYFQTPAAVPAPGSFSLTSATPACSGSNPQITLSWTASSGVSTYDVYRNGALYSPGVPAGTRTFLNTGSNVVSGTTYTYFIRARNASGSTDSNSLQATAPNCTTTPIPPTPASATPGSTSSPGPTTASSTVVVAWGASSGATYYDLGIRDVAAGSLVVSTQVNGTSYSANLTAGKQYRWNVAACNSSGCSAFTTALYFQTPVAVPGPGSFTLSSATPACNGSSPQITLSWTASSGVSTYDVYRNGALYSPGVPAGTQTFLNTGSNVVSGTTYTYFVRARNATGSTDSNSLQATAPNCSTTPIPATPASATPGSTSSPGPTTTSSTVVVTWAASSGATHYDLGIRDIAAGSLVVSTQVNGTSYSANLTAGKQFRWNVAACNSSGCSAFTTALYFQTPAAVPGPGSFSLTSASPACSGSNPQITLNWTASSGVSTYDVYRNGALYSPGVPAGTQSFLNTGSNVVSDTTYTYFIRARNASGSTDSNSLQATAPNCASTPIPATPTNTSPGSTSSPGPTRSSSTVVFTWAASSGATYYDLGIRDVAAGSLVVSTQVTGTSYSANLTAGKQYRWNVAACNTSGCSAFTTPLYFQTPAAVTVPGSFSLTSATPACSGTNPQITLNWTVSAGVSTYDVYRNGTLYSPGVPAGTQTFLNTGSNVVSGTTYTYFIRARNASGSTDSNSLQATAPSCATTPIPATPASTTPGSTSSPGPTTASSAVVVAWGASSGATYYDLGIRDVAAGSLVVSTQVTGTSYSANLTAGKRYRWNVAACNVSGCSAFTTPLYFQTPTPADCALACEAVVQGTADTHVPVHFSAIIRSCAASPSAAWDFGDGTSGAGADVTHSYASAGSYVWKFASQAADSSTCTRTGTITVRSTTAAPRITAFSASPLRLSPGAATTLTWSTEDSTSTTLSGVGSVASSGQVVLTPSATTEYVLKATNSVGSSEARVIVAVDPPLSAQIRATVIDGYIPFTSTLSVRASGGTPPYTYAWSTGDRVDAFDATFSSEGDFALRCTVRDARNATVITAPLFIHAARARTELTMTAHARELGAQSCTGAVADGVTVVQIEAESSRPGTVTFSVPAEFRVGNRLDGGLRRIDSATGTALSRSVTVNTTPTGLTHRAVALYQVPDDFNDESRSRSGAGFFEVTLSASHTANDNVTTRAKYRLNIVRPPVVLLHGIWSSVTQLKPLANALAERGYSVHVGSWDGYGSIAENQKAVTDSAQSALDQLKRNGIAGRKVDFVAHSMGGLLARRWGSGRVHKLITLNTPHHGSALADFLVEYPEIKLLVGFAREMGPALTDLQVGSTALALLPDFTAPAHAIGGDAAAFCPTSTQAVTAVACIDPRVRYRFGWSGIGGYAACTLLLQSRLLGSENDQVVSLESQLGGLSEDAGTATEFKGCFAAHTAATSSSEYPDEIARLLDEPVYQSSFATRFHQAYTSSPSAAPLVTSTADVTSDIKVISPGSGATVIAGSTVDLRLSVPPDINELVVLTPDADYHFAIPQDQVSIRVPHTALGAYSVAIVGAGDGDTLHSAPSDYALNVVPAAAVERLYLMPDTASLRVGAESRVFVSAVFFDGFIRDVPATEATYSATDPGVASVSTDGIISAHGPGRTSVSISYGGKTANVEVEVEADPGRRRSAGP